MEDIEVIKNAKYTTMENMLHDIYFHSGKLKNLNSGYIFRGEGSNEYQLLPSALRKSNQEKLLQIASGDSENSDKREYEFFQRMAELELLRRFYLKSNENGLKIYPTDTVSTFDEFAIDKLIKGVINKSWIPNDLENVAALAQHYGVMTRLLDWTFNFNVAFYFAAVNALNNICDTGASDKSMVIWALNYDELSRSSVNKSLKFVIPPYIDNPNLKTQKGILSYWKSDPINEEDMYKKRIDRTPLNEILQDNYSGDEIALYKIEMPISEAYKLLTFVNTNGYTTASLFPGYNGVASECNESEMINRARHILGQ
ncbi:FRG domain-containing protein [Lactobacillus crispatus]|uniref:FRG domain-containing protein n=1 Tax=Lactobacillus crispatus TaxID=47770 RepID=UPI0001BAE3C7|nr:FRG domain-containing protein [Lactobacillus crispatus]EEX28829.1 FRG domain protein [Lactobacillus crispatus MV-3A-US]MCT7824256.1 FRG domain-containing protein [Lactobacillus crispatus]MCZ3572049.1 FRG domain-containing protein [Lactobacillus crispatus]MCZ3578048.1 FRG domain-containing protein [Lactobacillus crispatus]MCZ3597380.1 FRG domain-containing protein [Lactobacillus crispatus]